MAVADNLISKTFMSLEIFLQKAASLDIFEVLMFNYKVKVGVLDPIAVHFLAIVAELANQLQLLSQETGEKCGLFNAIQLSVSDLAFNSLKSDSHLVQKTCIISVKSEDEIEDDGIDESRLVLTLCEEKSNLSETNASPKHNTSSLECLDYENITLAERLKQKKLKIVQKKICESEMPDEESNNRNGMISANKVKNGPNAKSLEFLEKSSLSDSEVKHEQQSESRKESSKSGTKRHKCDKCKCAFRTRRMLTSHINSVHKTEPEVTKEEVNNASNTVSDDNDDGEDDDDDDTKLLPENLPFLCCRTCLVVYKTQDEFDDHNCKHGVGSPEGSIMQKYMTNSKRRLMTSLEKLKLQKKFCCGICHEEYRSMARMSYHLPRCSHGPYRCELCSEEYAFKKDLNQHKKKTHRGSKSFFCDECGLNFKLRTSLQKHKVNRHEKEQGPYPCDECELSFTKRIQLTNHKISAHSLERKFLCQMCGKKFSNSGSLTTHMETHTEGRKFSCEYCSKQFRQKEKLKYHTRIHTGERPHLCQMCGKRFIRKSKLDEHMRRHRGEKRYHCTMCNKSYAAAWDLRLHNKKLHPDSVDQSGHLDYANVTTDGEDPDDPLSGTAEEECMQQLALKPDSGIAAEENLTVHLSSLSEDSKSVLLDPSTVSEGNKLLVQLESASEQQEEQEDGTVVGSSILVQLNSLQNHQITDTDDVSQQGNSRILLQLDPLQQPFILNGSATTSENGSKVIVQLDSEQQAPHLQDCLGSRILLHLDGGNNVQNANAAPSRILLQLDSTTHNAPLLTMTEAIQMTPLVDDVATQLLHTSSSQSDTGDIQQNGTSISIPLQIQLPISASLQQANSLQSLSLPGQAEWYSPQLALMSTAYQSD